MMRWCAFGSVAALHFVLSWVLILSVFFIGAGLLVVIGFVHFFPLVVVAWAGNMVGLERGGPTRPVLWYHLLLALNSLCWSAMAGLSAHPLYRLARAAIRPVIDRLSLAPPAANGQ